MSNNDKNLKQLMRKRLLNIGIKVKHMLYAECFSVCIVSIAFFLLLISIGIFIICGDWEWSLTLNEEKIGQFGDFIGGAIGTILAFAASLLYLIALKEQRKDVKTNQKALCKQVEEFQNQVKELEMSRGVYEKQLAMMRIQQFESYFYSYFNIYLDVKHQLMTGDSKMTLRKILEQLSKKIDNQQISSKDFYEAYKFALSKYCDILLMHRSELSHYFRSFYRLMTIVVSSQAMSSEKEKMKYIKIIRSQLLEEELLILYYNSHSPYAGESKKLLYQYNILKHLSPLRKYEIANRFKSQTGIIMSIERFYDEISPIIKNFINKICDDPENCIIEHLHEKLNLLVRLEYDENITITLIDKGGMKQFKLFCEVFIYLLYDFLFNSQFIGNRGKIDSGDESIIPETNYKQVSFIIDSTIIRKMIIDKDDE